VLTAEFAHAVLKVKDFQGRLTSNSKLSRPYYVLQDFPDPRKMTNLSRTFKALWPPCILFWSISHWQLHKIVYLMHKRLN